MTPTKKAIERLEVLGEISDSPSFLVRSFLSPANLSAGRQLIGWMEELGMQTTHAVDGTVRGILAGTDPNAPPLLLGSHLDTVIDAGKYDGALGLVTALAALESLAESQLTLPFPVHLLGFSDEEGVRFQCTYLGSRSVTEALDPATLSTMDHSGKTLKGAIETEGWKENSTPIHYTPRSTRGYVEVHIEQGRVLEEKNEAVAVVSAIAGQTRISITLSGQADHAGTTPMLLRRDALTGAAACILAGESLAHSHPPLVITTGKIDVRPGASNSIPQTATFTVDLRHPDDHQRRALLTQLKESYDTIAKARQLELEWRTVQEDQAVPCDANLTRALRNSLEAVTQTHSSLVSGAGHDGVAISKVAPIAMLFIRCREGISHHPDEFTAAADIGSGIQVLTHFLKSLSP